MSKNYQWYFPLPRTHTGMLLGNGTLGVMVWGEGNTLRVTVGRADLWDHRGGLQWTEQMSYGNIRECLETGNDARLNELFAAPKHSENDPQWPSVLPIGRVEFVFPPDAELTTGTLHLGDGRITVCVKQGGAERKLHLTLDMDSPVLAVEFPKGLSPEVIRRVSAWEFVGDYLQRVGFTPPEMVDADELTGWVQTRPADAPYCMGYRRAGRHLVLTVVAGDDAQAIAAALLKTALTEGGFDTIHTRVRAWWKDYWKTVPTVKIPNERLQFLYDYGMYKFAGLTNPTGVPATLQGPWIEEYQMPPWSSDYHFNINVQMCYWPAFHGNRLEHLLPLFHMVHGWTDTLRYNAKTFIGVEDGRMLPHAVDDRGTCIGGFWSGSLDHGCTAWVGQMMYRYYLYTSDEAFLREVAYPFMVGAMRVYQAMLEFDGERYSLPISVSPEYHAKNGKVWGRNASFQFACIHRLSADLQEAAGVLGADADPQWADISEKLPRACLVGEGDRRRVGIWENTPLEESHRHHSHLAGITPFDIYQPGDEEWSAYVRRALDEWTYHGMGLWSGWCVPWASMIQTRLGEGQMAELLLETWQRVFTNEGHGTLHDAGCRGFSLMGAGYAGEIMQMDAGMSCTTAIQEMLLHVQQGVTYLFAGAPKRWREATFAGMRTEGGFLLSSARKAGMVTGVKVESLCGGTLKLANPWSAPALIHRKGGIVEALSGTVLEIPMAKGEKLEINRA